MAGNKSKTNQPVTNKAISKERRRLRHEFLKSKASKKERIQYVRDHFEKKATKDKRKNGKAKRKEGTTPRSRQRYVGHVLKNVRKAFF